MKGNWILSLATVLLVASMTSCGGSGSQLISGVSNVVDLGSPDTSRTDHFSWNYDLNGYAEEDGFRLVPMLDDFNPAPAQGTKLTMNSDKDHGNPVLEIKANSSQTTIMHLRFDPEQWRVQKVVGANPWGNCHFDFLACVPQSGLLMIYSAPRTEGAIGNGKIAEVYMEPRSARSSSVTHFEPSEEDRINVIWYAEQTTNPPQQIIHSTGTFSYKLDGDLGDLSSKDNDWNGSDDQASLFSNVTQDAVAIPFYNPVNDPPDFPGEMQDITISWMERLTGDHDNNGVITISDITPIGVLDSGFPAVPTTRSKYRCKENGSFVSLADLMRLNIDNGGWTIANHDLQGFYCHGETGDWEYTCVDSFWDGFVRNYYNLDLTDDGELIKLAMAI